jgi:hypothetical protein
MLLTDSIYSKQTKKTLNLITPCEPNPYVREQYKINEGFMFELFERFLDV